MVVYGATPDGGVAVHLDPRGLEHSDIGVRAVDAGAIVVVAEDPGPATDPDREVIVLVDASRDYRGKARIRLGQLRPVPTGGFPRPTHR